MKNYVKEDRHYEDDYITDCGSQKTPKPFAVKLCRILDKSVSTSLEKVADEVGVSRQQFRKYMNGDTPSNRLIVKRIANYFQIPMYYLMEDDIEVSDTPAQLPVPEKFKGKSLQMIENSYFDYQYLMNDKRYGFLPNQQKEYAKEFQCFLETVGLNPGIYGILTEAAKKCLISEIRAVATPILYNKDNRFEPINPIDEDDYNET